MPLYSDGLADLGMEGPRAELSLALAEPIDPSASGVRVSVWKREPDDGPERAFATLCPGADLLDARGRAALVLDVVHAAVQRLAEARGWDPSRLDACRQHVVEQDFTYRWDGPWKSSPDRRHQARATYRLDEPDGFGRMRLEVRRRGEGGSILTSTPAVASCVASRFRDSAATLGWSDSSSVGLTPLVGHGPRGGAVTARLDGGSWTAVVRDDVTPRRPGVGMVEDPDAPVPTVVAELG
jgi:hypothetical protein